MKNRFNKIMESWYIPFSGGVLFVTPFVTTVTPVNMIICLVLGVSFFVYGFSKNIK